MRRRSGRDEKMKEKGEWKERERRFMGTRRKDGDILIMATFLQMEGSSWM